MSARKSKVAKARAALQSRLAQVPAKIRELDQARVLLQEATNREHELIEARANELVEDLYSRLSREQAEVSHLRIERGQALGKVDILRKQLAQVDDTFAQKVSRQAATIHRLGTEIDKRDGDVVFWRNVALSLGTLAIIFGGLLGNQLL